MRALRALLTHSPREWILLIRVAFWVIIVRAALALCPYKTVEAWLERRAASRAGDRRVHKPIERSNGIDSANHTKRLRLWATRAVSSRLLGSRPCLTQALVGRYLLALIGERATLRFGGTLGENRRFAAHAWLEDEDGAILLGGGDARTQYTPFQPLK